MPGLKITLLQRPLVQIDGPTSPRHFDRQLEGITGCDAIVLPGISTNGFAVKAVASPLAQDDVANWMIAKVQQCNALTTDNVALQTESGSVNRLLSTEPGGMVHFYNECHLFHTTNEHPHYKTGDARAIAEWRGWYIPSPVHYDSRFPVWSRNLNDYDLVLYIAGWLVPCSLHWRALLITHAIENQAYVAGHNHVGSDGGGCHYRSDSWVINPQGEIIAAADAYQATRTDAELSMMTLWEYGGKFPA